MSIEVKVQRDTKVFLAFSNEIEAGELRQLLVAVDWQRCPWAKELDQALEAAEVYASSASLEALLDPSYVVMA